MDDVYREVEQVARTVLAQQEEQGSDKASQSERPPSPVPSQDRPQAKLVIGYGTAQMNSAIEHANEMLRGVEGACQIL
jgi:hypothetical protein